MGALQLPNPSSPSSYRGAPLPRRLTGFCSSCRHSRRCHRRTTTSPMGGAAATEPGDSGRGEPLPRRGALLPPPLPRNPRWRPQQVPPSPDPRRRDPAHIGDGVVPKARLLEETDQWSQIDRGQGWLLSHRVQWSRDG